MTDLASWLLTRIAEDEWVARKTRELYLRWAHRRSVTRLLDAQGQILDWYARHVLAECEAKRRIIEAFKCVRVLDYSEYRDDASFNVDWGKQSALVDVLRFLALPYADRPGYLEEWRP